MGQFAERAGVLSLVAVLVVAWGCGDERGSATSSDEQATVKGTVYINGKTATKGKVVFDPANYRRKDVSANEGSINKDGTYTVKTLVGENAVRVEGPEAEQASATYANIRFDVKSGENSFDIKLPPEQ